VPLRTSDHSFTYRTLVTKTAVLALVWRGGQSCSKAFAARETRPHVGRLCIVSDESHEQRHARFARIRRTKWLLRFTPRRASLHRYPLIGRFADFARKRSYLWSFRGEYVRPALYAGSITALLPIMGVQLPVAFILAVLLRANVMVLGGLQFITNPFTAVPIYYGTHQLGQIVIRASGFGSSVDVDPPPVQPRASFSATDIEALGEDEGDDASSHPLSHPALKWTRRFGTAINALVLGGVLGGCALGFILDLVWQFGAARAAKHRRKVAAHRQHSRSTRGRTPPM
jgi:uncharacterized protein (DUF2062 family)